MHASTEPYRRGAVDKNMIHLSLPSKSWRRRSVFQNLKFESRDAWGQE